MYQSVCMYLRIYTVGTTHMHISYLTFYILIHIYVFICTVYSFIPHTCTFHTYSKSCTYIHTYRRGLFGFIHTRLCYAFCQLYAYPLVPVSLFQSLYRSGWDIKFRWRRYIFYTCALLCVVHLFHDLDFYLIIFVCNCTENFHIYIFLYLDFFYYYLIFICLFLVLYIY